MKLTKDYFEKFKNQSFLISENEIEKATDELKKVKHYGNRVYITGVGKTSYVAGYGSALMSSLNFPVIYVDATEIAHGSAGMFEPGDVLIAISNSGETFEILRAAECVLDKHAEVIAITGNIASKLAKMSVCTIFAGVTDEGGPWNKAPRLSINAECTVLELISLEMQLSDESFTKDEYLKNHKAGAIGDSLRKEK